VMAVAALGTEAIFRGAGLVPRLHPTQIAPEHFSWNYTSYLNLLFLVVFGVLYVAYRNRVRLGGGQRSVIDPVCGMQVQRADAPASLVYAEEHLFFCSDRCKLRFEESPSRFTQDQVDLSAPSSIRSSDSSRITSA
jgi:YHS domain-containing protein